MGGLQVGGNLHDTDEFELGQLVIAPGEVVATAYQDGSVKLGLSGTLEEVGRTPNDDLRVEELMSVLGRLEVNKPGRLFLDLSNIDNLSSDARNAIMTRAVKANKSDAAEVLLLAPLPQVEAGLKRTRVNLVATFVSDPDTVLGNLPLEATGRDVLVELKESEEAGEMVVIASHIPMLPGSARDKTLLWNYEKLLPIINR